MVNGAQAVIRTLVDAGVDVCFANPGTSEMHFVAALDDVPEMRAVLTLFEGVATGAADGFARMSGRPAATLLHLGPGLGNGWANLHNARRGRAPVVVVVGDHALAHKRRDAPLESDLDALAGAVGWVRRSLTPGTVGTTSPTPSRPPVGDRSRRWCCRPTSPGPPVQRLVWPPRRGPARRCPTRPRWAGRWTPAPCCSSAGTR